MRGRRGPNWVALVILGFGLLLVYGAVSTYRDQHSGTAARATVTDCGGGTGLSKFRSPTACRGTWRDGRVVSGPIDGAEKGDIGKTIDVRVHGDHATVPAIGTSIMFLVLGAPIVLFGAVSLRPAGPQRS